MLGENLLFFSTALMIHLFRQSTRLAAEVTQAGDEGPAPPQITTGDGGGPLKPSTALLIPVTPALEQQLHVNSEVTGAFPPQTLAWSSTSQCHDVLLPARQQRAPQCSATVHSTTESTYSGSLRCCRSGFGNVGTAGVAGAPVAAVLGPLAVFVAAAGCIPQCFAVAH